MMILQLLEHTKHYNKNNMKPIRIDKFYQGQQESKYFEGVVDTKNIDVFNELGTARCNDGWTKIVDQSETGEYCDLITNMNNDLFLAIVGKNTGSSQKIEVYRHGITAGITTKHAESTDPSIYKPMNIGGFAPTLTTGTDSMERLYIATAQELFELKAFYCTGNDVAKKGTFTGVANHYLCSGDKINTNEGPRQILVSGLDLYIATDGHIASVDASGVYSDNVLDLMKVQFITDITVYGTDLLICGYSEDKKGFVVRYDTYSESFYAPDITDEPVYSLMPSDDSNIVFASVGNKGAIYYYNGNTLEFYKRRNYEDTDVLTPPQYRMHVAKEGNTIFQIKDGVLHSLKKPLLGNTFALTSSMTTPVVFSDITQRSGIIYGISEGNVYKTDPTANKTEATITTSLVQGKADYVTVGIAELPTGTNITIETMSDNDKWIIQPTTTDIKDENIVRTTNAIRNMRTLQVRVTLTPNGSETPVIEYIDII